MLSKKTSIPNDQARLAVSLFFGAIRDALRAGRRVEFRGFGSFVVRDYRSGFRRNPRTGERVFVGPRRKAVFKVSPRLRERLGRLVGSGESGG